MQGTTSDKTQRERQTWQPRDPALDDLKLEFQPNDQDSIDLMFNDPAGNLVRIGALTQRGAMRLIGRIALVTHLDVVIKVREQ